MSSCEQLSSGAGAALACPSSSDLQEDMSSSTLALLAGSDLPSSASSVATTALHLEHYASELLLWLQRSTCAADDALVFFETNHPELLDDLPLLFAWLALFLAQHEDAAQAARAVQTLDSSGDLAATAQQFALKSALTLLYWKHETERSQLRADDVEAPDRSRPAFQHETELLQWVLAHRQVPLTRQDIVNHVLDEYPVFAASKSAAALKVWTARFLKKYLPPQSSLASAPPADAVVAAVPDVSVGAADMMAVQSQEEDAGPLPDDAAQATSPTPLLLPQHQKAAKDAEDVHSDAAAVPDADASMTSQQTGKRRSCSGRYMLFSNEFKLHAVSLLDEGKSVAEVAEELGLKNPSCLNYWRSIRDKLVTAERKRFRLAGGGRRSSCNFEDELLTWVSERHQQGQGTDVKAVLEYMRQYHSSFTEGKKEPTLRKWILRFFKRCWRAPSTSMDSQDAEKSYIFV
ncbi:hypothetical protein PF005_g285 [Phytophthora fragariae]|uniref:Uncharacterized protein n=1 Tax=Phytophthora fragariae TaxID=53985 RepID=A0A6A4AM86_9STRA|nr:hypothetical protein PF003_g26374 [Phytophthora fragariae]KAE8950266.1 hypothetical protein PF009_g233 [Phytophthora fragariae]KAE9026679.1 hypothetical protein PF011_g2427 [Phytophthora fragariae]KAE9136723.1 hypothetical protein PF010_g1576 [Phytophthora fragariae]KAE9141428.1 hypothetical protein PF007_g234 [Phytophthora fragariae]